MTRTRKDGTAPPSRAAWEGKAAAFREAAAELQRLTAASGSARHVASTLGEWLDRQAKRCDRRAASIRPGRKRDQLAYLANYREPGKAGRPATGAPRDATVFAEVERWRDEQEQRTGQRPNVTEACRAVAAQQPRRGGQRRTDGAIRSAYNRHALRSKTSAK